MDAADLILEVGEVAEGQKDGLVRRQGPDSGRWQGEGQPSTDSGGNRRREGGCHVVCEYVCVTQRPWLPGQAGLLYRKEEETECLPRLLGVDMGVTARDMRARWWCGREGTGGPMRCCLRSE